MCYSELRYDFREIIKDFLREGNLAVEISSDNFSSESKLEVRLTLYGETIAESYTFLPTHN